MTNQPLNFYLPFALPKYGNAMQKNAYFVQSAGEYLMPMRSYAYGVVEQFGGVVVAHNTRFHNVEFKVANGQHFMQIIKAMGINITHMTPVNGGYKCHKDGNMNVSTCFVQKKVTKGTGHIEYTAILALRHVARELFLAVFPPAPEQEKNEAPKDNFMEEALSMQEPQHVEHPEDFYMNPEPPASEEVVVSENDLPLGL